MIIFLLSILQRTTDVNSSLYKLSPFLYALLGMYFFLVFTKYMLNLKKHRLGIWFLIFIILLVISCFWSQDYLVTLRASIALVATTLYGYYLYLRLDIEEFFNTILTGLTIVLIISILVVIVFPEKATHTAELHSGAWKGIYFHKSVLGKDAALAAIIALFMLKKPVNILYFLGCLIVAFKAQSMVAVVCLVLSLGYYMFSNMIGKVKQIKRHTLVYFGFALILLFILGYAHLQTFLEILGKDPTFNGRTTIWIFSVYSILQSPILGYGYLAFWRDDALSDYVGWDMPHAHNHFLDVTLDVGFLGLFVFLIVLIRLYAKIYLLYRINKNISDIFFMSTTGLLLISSTENSMHQPFSLVWIFFSAATLYVENKKISKYVNKEKTV